MEINGPTILRWFTYAHLPDHLRATSKPFADLAAEMAAGFDDMDGSQKAETVAGLRKLLEAKDCAVRARIGPL